jgi:hypothetical protein
LTNNQGYANKGILINMEIEGGNMGNRTSIVCSRAIGFKKQEEKGEQRLKAGIEKFREALEQDAKEAAAHGSGLPKDWRSRILK